jgi:hypothetical protein
MKTMVAYVPAQKIGVVVLSNYVTELPELLAFRFFDQYSGKPERDYSAEGLAGVEKTKEEKKAHKPAPPAKPAAAMPLETYTGDYSNPVYGKINVSVVDGKLNITIGPKRVKLDLEHWDKDIFRVKWPISDDEFDVSFALFEMDPQGKVTRLELDALDQDDGLGIFERVNEAKEAVR